MRITTLLLATILGFATQAWAEAPAKGFRYGLDVGSNTLHGDLNSQGTKLAAGFHAAYQFNDQYSIEIAYVGTSFEDLDHRVFDVGGSWYFENEGPELHASAGFSFLHNDFKLLSRAGDAAGIYAGGGLSWGLTPKVRAGFDLRFHKAFPAKATVAGTEITTVSDSTTALIVVTYHPDFSE